jgi:hypothetical protein
MHLEKKSLQDILLPKERGIKKSIHSNSYTTFPRKDRNKILPVWGVSSLSHDIEFYNYENEREEEGRKSRLAKAILEPSDNNLTEVLHVQAVGPVRTVAQLYLILNPGMAKTVLHPGLMTWLFILNYWNC